MTSAEFIKWASSPEGMAILGTGGVLTVGAATLYQTGVAARVTKDILGHLKAGWHFRKPRAWVDKTAKAATVFVAVYGVEVTFDAAWAREQTSETLVSQSMEKMSIKAPNMQIPPRSEFYTAISTVKANIDNY